MTPSEQNIVKSLIAVAWADGRVQDSESDVISAMLTAFDATAAEKEDLRAYAAEERTLDDIPLDDLTSEDRDLLLGNAAVLVRSDGEEAGSETDMVNNLARLLGFDAADAEKIVEQAKDGALQLKSSSLIPQPPTAPSAKKG